MAERDSKPFSEGDRAALAMAVTSRRKAMGWTQAQAAGHGGISGDRIQMIEQMRTQATIRQRTLLSLDAAMCWAPESSLAVLNGGTPVELDVPSKPRKALPAGYRVEVLTTGQATPRRSFRLVSPTWEVPPTGELDLLEDGEVVATFAAGFWRSVSREEATE